MERIRMIIHRIQQIWQKPARATKQSVDMLLKLLSMVDQTEEVEYSCDEVHQLLDQYTEMVARGEDAAGLMPLIRHHLNMCKDCHEEYEALLRVLETMPA